MSSLGLMLPIGQPMPAVVGPALACRPPGLQSPSPYKVVVKKSWQGTKTNQVPSSFFQSINQSVSQLIDSIQSRLAVLVLLHFISLRAYIQHPLSSSYHILGYPTCY